MKKFWLALFALLLGAVAAVAPAQAADRHRFVVGLNTQVPYQHQLADLVRVSYQKDPNGNAVLSEESCKVYNACGTPNMYLGMFKESQPEVGPSLNSSNLAAYIDTLVPVTAPTGRYWMACISGKGMNARAILHCFSRVFTPNEIVLADPRTKKVAIAGDCGNAVDRPDKPIKCAYIDFALGKAYEPHIGDLGAEKYVEDPDCLMALQKVGETDITAPPIDECPRDRCDFSQPARFLGGVVIQDKPRISFVAEKASAHDNVVQFYRLRVSARRLESSNVFVFCVIGPDGRQTKGEVITKRSYRKNAKGEMVAYIASAGEFTPDEVWTRQGGTVRIWTDSITGKPF